MNQPMTPEYFKNVRIKLGLSQREMARVLGLTDPRAIRGYESGERYISGPIAVLMGIFNDHGVPPYEKDN